MATGPHQRQLAWDHDQDDLDDDTDHAAYDSLSEWVVHTANIAMVLTCAIAIVVFFRVIG